MKDIGTDRTVWLFNAPGAKNPGGIFIKKSSAEPWISRSGLTGVLTLYPLDVGVYDWAVGSDRFESLNDYQRSAAFVSNFSSGSQPYYGYESGLGGGISEGYSNGAEYGMADQMAGYEKVWVFTGPRAEFPSGVFTSREVAEAWIGRHGLSGTLTKYPVDISVYDWAVSTKAFKPKRDDQKSPEFIARFSSASQEHIHYEGGVSPQSPEPIP